MRTLLVSIIIPTYNRAQMIQRAVDSVLTQCREGDEVIVVDDGSTDSTQQKLKRYGDRIRYLHIPNSGAGAARNHGIDEARNDLVAFLDSDDEWMPNKLELQRSLMQARPDILYSFSNFAVKDRHGEVIRRYLARWHDDTRSWDEIMGAGIPYSKITSLPDGMDDFMVHIGDLYHSLAARLYVSTITIVVRKKEAGKALRFESNIPLYEDWACFGKLAKTGSGAYLDCETAWNYGHNEGRLTDTDHSRRALARLLILERVWGADKDFIAENGDYYREIVDNQRAIHVSYLLYNGNTRQARQELRKMKNPPIKHRLLSIIPGKITQYILGLRLYFKAIKI